MISMYVCVCVCVCVHSCQVHTIEYTQTRHKNASPAPPNPKFIYSIRFTTPHYTTWRARHRMSDQCHRST